MYNKLAAFQRHCSDTLGNNASNISLLSKLSHDIQNARRVLLQETSREVSFFLVVVVVFNRKQFFCNVRYPCRDENVV